MGFAEFSAIKLGFRTTIESNQCRLGTKEFADGFQMVIASGLFFKSQIQSFFEHGLLDNCLNRQSTIGARVNVGSFSCASRKRLQFCLTHCSNSIFAISTGYIISIKLTIKRVLTCYSKSRASICCLHWILDGPKLPVREYFFPGTFKISDCDKIIGLTTLKITRNTMSLRIQIFFCNSHVFTQ